VPLNLEIHSVLTTTHTGALTIGLVLAVYFASSGVESLRIGLNRAYKMVETRHWILLRLESIGYVLLAALGAFELAVLKPREAKNHELKNLAARQSPRFQGSWAPMDMNKASKAAKGTAVRT